MADNTVYFAAKPSNDAAGILLEKATSFYKYMDNNAYIDKIQKQWLAYYGSYTDYGLSDHEISFGGEQGELVNLPVNHYRNLAQHLFVMVTANRPIMEARAVNTDYKSLAQTYLANGILEYYMREKRLEDHLKKAVEMAIVMGSGYVKMDWNSTTGEIYDTDEETGIPIYEGELEFSNPTPLDVVFDGTKESWNHDWLMVRTFKNRFDLMAKYPEFTDKIQAVPAKDELNGYRFATWTNDDTDDIPVFEFFHRKTESMPDGRYMLFVDSEAVLIDMKLPYRTIPIFRVTPSDILGTSYGYSPMFDIYPIQEGLNSLYSAVMTNQNAFMVQNVFVKRGSDLTISQLEGGLNVIEGNEKPESLNLTETPAEVFKFIDVLERAAETLSGVNSVTRGNPEASLKSGNALALVQSMALQFMSGLQQSYVKLIEDCGTSLIQILKDYAKTPKVVALVGKNQKSFLKEFTGDNISAINRVIVDMGNALSRTTAGRVQMADQMLQMGTIKNPQQYFQVINTGKIEVMFEGEMTELLNVKAENEKMMSGEQPMAIFTDKHQMHINEHKSILDDPELRADPELVSIVAAHIQEHITLLRTTDPDTLMLLGQQPLAPPGMAPPNAGPGAPMGPNGAPIAPPQPGGPGGPMGEMMTPEQSDASAGPLPAPATPPPPFENLPTDPTQAG